MKTELLFEINLTLGAGERQDVGTTPSGTRVIVPVIGGTFTGSHLQGTVLPERGDWALQRADGVTVLDVRVTLRTHDNHPIYMTYRRDIHRRSGGTAGVWQNTTVDPVEYYIRTTTYFETGSE